MGGPWMKGKMTDHDGEVTWIGYVRLSVKKIAVTSIWNVKYTRKKSDGKVWSPSLEVLTPVGAGPPDVVCPLTHL